MKGSREMVLASSSANKTWGLTSDFKACIVHDIACIAHTYIVCNPLSSGVDPFSQSSKRGGLTKPQFLEGGLLGKKG